MNPSDPIRPPLRRAAILLAKASITGAAVREMEELAQRAQAAMAGCFAAVVPAFSEQGSPSLREALDALAAGNVADEIAIVPLLLPMEPGFRTWITGAVQRWMRDAQAPRRPGVTLCMPPGDTLAVDALVHGLLQSTTVPIDAPAAAPSAGSVIPPQKRRVLVCQGGPCNHAGAALVWGHLRNEQKRLDLRNTGEGMMSARTSCLGPCNLAPVVQVFPEGTWYGGVDEAGIDRIVESHLLRGEPVAELAYPQVPGKQTLR
ncbi:(2Fe-2S) ferredoxin domain-containing protein [Acidovorax sp. SUPP2825]|uniref:(2Fe-2S) ferredoxin domain-containing protein n=1 Tax=Acidovorax sp. SUPP2825 TaxID=2920879 RepID=UPI0023DE6611|nr:(2Fe-2S) ferredoxin domain-containing protein [Acidovorax sp. SUPP2825]GKS96732.1 NAD(P)H-dependent oxidoreductase subunit E [Acidovorax sp. SUPP2825]